MTTTYFIAGSAFIVLSIVWGIMKSRDRKKKKEQEARRDGVKAMDDRDVGRLLGALRRLRKSK